MLGRTNLDILPYQDKTQTKCMSYFMSSTWNCVKKDFSWYRINRPLTTFWLFIGIEKKDFKLVIIIIFILRIQLLDKYNFEFYYSFARLLYLGSLIKHDIFKCSWKPRVCIKFDNIETTYQFWLTL